MNRQFGCEACGFIEELKVNGRLSDRNWYLTSYVCKKCGHNNDIASVDWQGVRVKNKKEMKHD